MGHYKMENTHVERLLHKELKRGNSEHEAITGSKIVIKSIGGHDYTNIRIPKTCTIFNNSHSHLVRIMDSLGLDLFSTTEKCGFLQMDLRDDFILCELSQGDVEYRNTRHLRAENEVRVEETEDDRILKDKKNVVLIKVFNVASELWSSELNVAQNGSRLETFVLLLKEKKKVSRLSNYINEKDILQFLGGRLTEIDTRLMGLFMDINPLLKESIEISDFELRKGNTEQELLNQADEDQKQIESFLTSNHEINI